VEEDDYRHINVGTSTEIKRTSKVLGGDVPDPAKDGFCLWAPRPRTRGECPKDGICPFVGCRFHLAADETLCRGKLKARLASGFILLERNCALDFVDSHPGGATLEEVGAELTLTRERVRQIEVTAMAKLKVLVEEVDLY
jgi:hypothetical protein